MFEKILLPLDGSEIAEIILPYGEELASRLGSKLFLLHVKGPEYKREFEHIHQIYMDRLVEATEQNIKNSNSQAAIKISTIIQDGDPQENICNIIDKEHINLVIMTSVSALGLKVGKTIGSVTDHVSRTVKIPIMLIRPRSVEGYSKGKALINRILGPLDGSDLSNLSLPVIEELSRRLNINVVLFQMAQRTPVYSDSMGNLAYFNYSEIDAEVESQVRSQMSALDKELKDKGLKVSTMVTAGFDAAGEIIQAVQSTKADLVVMSTHGRSGIGRWVFGNVAEKVLRHGETPLLLVHAKSS